MMSENKKIREAEDEVKRVENVSIRQPSALNLFVIPLGPGDHNGFDIDFQGWTGNNVKYQSSQWLSQGYDGVLFQGAGKGLTHIRPVADTNILVGLHDGIVAFEDLTIHCENQSGRGKGLHMGLSNPKGPVYPKFKAILKNVDVVCENRAVWGLFSYQCDWELEDVTFDLANLNEHGLYCHGFAKEGVVIDNLTSHGTGAECLKFTARPSECQWVPNAWIIVRGANIANWYQPWSWRGGAGFVSQGSSAHILIQDSLFWGGEDSNRGRCIMIDDGWPRFYSSLDGTKGEGPAQGHVIIRRTGVAISGGS
jgi:hypothetical protein